MQTKLFEDKSVRTIWDEEHEKWYFSVVDVVAVLTESTNPTDYFKKLRKRDPELSSFVGTNCPQISMIGHTGKRRMTLVADTEDILRIIQSIPSPKAEPFKVWMAQVGASRDRPHKAPGDGGGPARGAVKRNVHYNMFDRGRTSSVAKVRAR